MGLTINKKLTTVNYNKGPIIPKYIIIHYVGATGGAEANCNYFYSINRGASANYFVGHYGEIWQCVKDTDIAWHVGDDTYKHPYARNTNSIGIEMCCRQKDGKWYFKPETVESTIALTKELMEKHNIPASCVLRHYDVTGKICPEPYVSNMAAWNKFKKSLEELDMTKEETQKMIDNAVVALKKQLAESEAAISSQKCPKWAAPAVQYCIDKGYIKGDGKKEPSPDNVRPMGKMTRAEMCQIIFNLEQATAE